jgi:hypothetical protein
MPFQYTYQWRLSRGLCRGFARGHDNDFPISPWPDSCGVGYRFPGRSAGRLLDREPDSRQQYDRAVPEHGYEPAFSLERLRAHRAAVRRRVRDRNAV